MCCEYLLPLGSINSDRFTPLGCHAQCTAIMPNAAMACRLYVIRHTGSPGRCPWTKTLLYPGLDWQSNWNQTGTDLTVKPCSSCPHLAFSAQRMPSPRMPTCGTHKYLYHLLLGISPTNLIVIHRPTVLNKAWHTLYVLLCSWVLYWPAAASHSRAVAQAGSSRSKSGPASGATALLQYKYTSPTSFRCRSQHTGPIA